MTLPFTWTNIGQNILFCELDLRWSTRSKDYEIAMLEVRRSYLLPVDRNALMSFSSPLTSTSPLVSGCDAA